MTVQTFLVKHRRVIISCISAAITSLVIFALLFAAVFFGYFHMSPQDTVGITITPTEITGTKEDGSVITGFMIEKDGSQYLVTDYWTPIQLTDEEPAA